MDITEEKQGGETELDLRILSIKAGDQKEKINNEQKEEEGYKREGRRSGKRGEGEPRPATFCTGQGRARTTFLYFGFSFLAYRGSVNKMEYLTVFRVVLRFYRQESHDRQDCSIESRSCDSWR